MKKKILYLLCGVCMLFACSQNSEKTDSPTDGLITISTDIQPLTRRPHMDETGNGNFLEGDRFALMLSGDGMTSMCKDYYVGHTALLWNDPAFASASNIVRFSGCYPLPSETEGSDFVFDVSQASEKDLLLAPAVEVKLYSAEVIRLSFHHALHRLKIIYQMSSDYTEEEATKIQTSCRARSTCRVDLESGQIKEVLNTTSVFKEQGAEVSFLLPPQTADGIDLNIDMGEESQQYNLGKWLQENGILQTGLDGGRELVLTLRVSRQGINIEGSGIGGWENQGSADGEISVTSFLSAKESDL